jgi:hypothetical protein
MELVLTMDKISQGFSQENIQIEIDLYTLAAV